MNETKIILKDGTEIQLESGSFMGAIEVRSESREAMLSTWSKITPDNLKEVKVKTGEEITGTYTELVLVSETSTVDEKGAVSTVYCLREKTENEKLKERIEQLEANMKVHDGAIGDLGEVTSLLAEQIDGEVQ